MTNDIQWPAWQDVPFDLPAKNEGRLLIAIDVEPQSTNIGSQLTRQGLQFRIIYKSQLAGIQKMVQTKEHADRLATARGMWEIEFARHRASCGSEEEARATFGPTPEMFYEQLPGGKGGRPPLKSLRVHPNEIPAPHVPEQAAEQLANAQTAALEKQTAILAELVKAIGGRERK